MSQTNKKGDVRTELLTIPNMLSMFRILLAPVFVWMVLKGRPFESLLIFCVAGVTDVLDGFTARVFHQKTKLGTILDPAGDKLLMAASFIVLTIPSLGTLNVIPLWLTITVFSRDLLIVSGALVAYLTWGQTTFTPSLLGKVSTVCQVGTIFLVLLFNFTKTSPPYLAWGYYTTLVFTLASGMHYIALGIHMLIQHKKARA